MLLCIYVYVYVCVASREESERERERGRKERRLKSRKDNKTQKWAKGKCRGCPWWREGGSGGDTWEGKGGVTWRGCLFWGRGLVICWDEVLWVHVSREECAEWLYRHVAELQHETFLTPQRMSFLSDRGLNYCSPSFSIIRISSFAWENLLIKYLESLFTG